jgi:adenylosuccinate lyase
MAIDSVSPIDGRYQSKTKELSAYFSEKALIKYRVMTEIKYLQLLSEKGEIGIRKFTDNENSLLEKLYDITDEDANIVKEIETKGFKNILATNHDVKAIEYFIKYKLENSTLKDIYEIIHLALTSEDINNISYSLMLRDGFNEIVFPYLISIYEKLYDIAVEFGDAPMLARTHGQPASPTTLGKEILVYVSRLKEEIKLLQSIPLLLKLNGATGNYNAHNIIFPGIDWQNFTKELINKLKSDFIKKSKYYSKNPLSFSHNKITTQIEPHDSMSRIFDSIKRINTILIGFNQDIWRYISDGWIKQKTIKGEIGSSAMPHKVNPIDFENAEGNLGIANTLFSFFSQKLMISRLQRDLSDSTVIRNVGVAFAHSLIAYQSIIKGISKIDINVSAMLEELQNNPEVVAEAYQNILRIEGVEKPYELLKEVTRGKNVVIEDFYNLAKNLNISDKIKQKLLSIKPENYIGIAGKIVKEFDPNIL